MKTGSKSIPCFSGMRASFATNHGSELMPMGENGNGTFFNACACSVALDQRNKTRGRIIGSLRIALRSGGQNGNSREPFISNPFTYGRSPVYYTRPSGVNEPRHFRGELSTPHLTKNGSRLSVEALRMGGEL